MNFHLALLSLLCAGESLLAAPQEGPLVADPALSLAGTPAAAGGGPLAPDFLIPIHSAQDDPEGGAYGTWAAGDRYKVSLGEEVGFYPVLGPEAPRHLPVHWRTTSVRVGTHSVGEELLDGAPMPWHAGGLRYELRYGRVTEVWEVRRDGVAQSFVIEAPPAARGDLVVTGTVRTELEPDRQGVGHGPIEFLENGVPTVRYGAAFAVDASGRRLEIATELDGDAIRLRVPAEWLREARWPVTVDPLLSTTRIASGPGEVFNVDVCRDDRANHLMTVFSRRPTGTDRDVYAYLTDDTFSGPVRVYSDITTSWRAVAPNVAFVGGANRWVIGFQREFSRSVGLRAHLHAGGDRTLSTSYTWLPSVAGQIEATCDVGGTTGFSSGTDAMVVYTVHQTQSSGLTIYGDAYAVRLDAVSGTFQTPVRLSPFASGQRYGRGRLSINQYGDDGWITVFEERDWSSSTPDTDVMIARLRADGSVVGHGWLDNSPMSEVRPQVAGRDGRYLVTYGVQSGSTTTTWKFTAGIACRRVDWPLGRFANFASRVFLLGSASGFGTWANESLAYDNNSTSFWQLATTRSNGRIETFRVGYDLRVVEQLSLPLTGYDAALTYDDDARRFVLSQSDQTSSSAVHGTRIDRPAGVALPYGSGCGAATIASSGDPLLGSRNFELRLSRARPRQTAALFIAAGSQNRALDFVGLPGCSLLVSSTEIALPAVTDANGGARVPMPIPGLTALRALRFQWIHFAPGANALGLQLTRGLELRPQGR